jgi:serine/threonine protein phosphatase PrpC
MTRSFGDIMASKVGVISEPEILEFEIQKGTVFLIIEHKFMVIASDGLWEFISN